MKTMFASACVVLFASILVGRPSDDPPTSILGSDLTGWMNSKGDAYDGQVETPGKKGPGWTLAEGVLVRSGSGGGYIWTQKRYGDFVLELEVKTRGNSGIFFRTDNVKDPVQTGLELQILTQGGPDQRKGFCSIYDVQAPSKVVTCGMDQWRHLTLRCNDNVVRVLLDGEQVNELDLNQWTQAHKNPDGSPNKYKRPIKDYAREGHIGFQDHGSEVRYRNIRIKKL